MQDLGEEKAARVAFLKEEARKAWFLRSLDMLFGLKGSCKILVYNKNMSLLFVWSVSEAVKLHPILTLTVPAPTSFSGTKQAKASQNSWK